MTDQYGRDIRYLRISVTDRCNLRCIYCMPEEGVPCVSHSDILTYDEITRICRIGTELGISRIKLTGGEPLVRRGLPDLLRMLKALPGIEQVTLTTNGALLKENLGALTDAGLDGVNISIDTPDAARYEQVTRGGKLSDALEGLEAALAYPALTVRLNCVPMQEMPEEDYIRLAELSRENVMDVRFIEMMPLGQGKAFPAVRGERVYRLLGERFGEAGKCEGTFGNGPAVYVRFPGFTGKTGFIDALSHQFCSACNRVRLTSEGILKPCLQYGTGTDLRRLLRSGAGDDEIKAAMEQTIYEKPACHQFAKDRQEAAIFETRDMSQIGG